MPVLIDANNTLHVTGVLPPEIAGVDEGGLAQLINGSRYGSDVVCLVCDGAARGRPLGPIGAVQFIYSGPRQSADAVIARLVTACTAPRSMTVVSNDRAVKKHASRRRCRVLAADEFLATLAQDHLRRARASSEGRAGAIRPRTATVSPEQVEAWKAYFGLADPASLEALKRASREGPAHRKPHDRRSPRQL